MATADRARLTRDAGMKFAFTLAAAFAVLSALAAWRRRQLTGEVLFALASALVLLGAFVPTRLGPVERGWMAFGRAIGHVTAPVALAVIYFVALTPIAVLRRTFGRSPLARDPKAPSYWVPRAPVSGEDRKKTFERQF